MTGYYEWSPNLVDWYSGDGVDGPGGGPTMAIVPTTTGSVSMVAASLNGYSERLFLRAGVTRN